MALIYAAALGRREQALQADPGFRRGVHREQYECTNRRCISATEDVDRLFRRQSDGTCRCAYCEAKARQE